MTQETFESLVMLYTFISPPLILIGAYAVWDQIKMFYECLEVWKKQHASMEKFLEDNGYDVCYHLDGATIKIKESVSVGENKKRKFEIYL